MAESHLDRLRRARQKATTFEVSGPGAELFEPGGALHGEVIHVPKARSYTDCGGLPSLCGDTCDGCQERYEAEIEQRLALGSFIPLSETGENPRSLEMLAAPHAELVTQAEIARRLGVKRQSVYRWTLRPSFPRRVKHLKRPAVYVWADVLAWREGRGK